MIVPKTGRGIIPDETISSGADQPWSVWKTLNHLRVEKRCLQVLKTWGMSPSECCERGETQAMARLLNCTLGPQCNPRICQRPQKRLSHLPTSGKITSDFHWTREEEEEYSSLSIISLSLSVHLHMGHRPTE